MLSSSQEHEQIDNGGKLVLLIKLNISNVTHLYLLDEFLHFSFIFNNHL